VTGARIWTQQIESVIPVVLEGSINRAARLLRTAKDKDNERQDRRSGYGRRHRIYISAGIAIILLLIMLLYFKFSLLGLGGEEPDLCVERNRYGCVYGDYRRSSPKDETLMRPDTATTLARSYCPWFVGSETAHLLL
jgi:hypothetical protein